MTLFIINITDEVNILSIKHNLIAGHVYRGEILRSVGHNRIKYGRVPTNNVIVFDIQDSTGRFLDRETKEEICNIAGLEVVPLLGEITFNDADVLKSFIKESVLGESIAEGVVIKPVNYDIMYDGKVLMGKYVREDFKEAMLPKVRATDKLEESIVALIEGLKTESRWYKAVQHLSDAGELIGDPKDIGKIVVEVQKDILKEETEEIKDFLFELYRKRILVGASNGVAQWYKDKLLQEQLDT